MHLNVMFDLRPMYPQMYHPHFDHRSREFKGRACHGSRARHPVKYYLIDFGLSRKYDADNLSPREWPIRGGDKSVPEFKTSNDPMDPYPTDINYSRNLVREHLLGVGVPLLT